MMMKNDPDISSRDKPDITKNNSGGIPKKFVLIVRKYIMAGLIQKYVQIVAVF